MKKMKNNVVKVLGLWALVSTFASCQDYLDVVPDNVATIDNAFTLRNEAERYLFTCYSYLPGNGDALSNTGFLAGDEVWIPFAQRELLGNNWHIARGSQTVNSPLVNIWGGGMWRAIRDCNIFLENVSDESKVVDLTSNERSRWLGEALFLKAYYHFLLMRAYGPIPIIRDNLDIDATAEEVRAEQRPVDEVVDYVVSLLDSATNMQLPSIISDRANELGRITRPIVLAVKANVLLTAASPLFNGNSDYASFYNTNGEQLFSQIEDNSKWERAATAALEAIQAAEAAGFRLYTFNANQYGQFTLSDTTIIQMSIRNGFNERWQTEHIWANPNSTAWSIQRDAMPLLSSDGAISDAREHLAAPLKIAEMFYTKNGVPIMEDRTLDFTNRYTLRTAEHDERFNIREGYQTARLNFDREPRFYASLGFDGGVWFKFDTPSLTDENTYVLEGKATQLSGANTYGWMNETGYFLKKLVNWEQAFTASGVSYQSYPWPDIRLSDVYLAYAEAANEAYGPSAEVFQYLDRIRERAGLEGVEASWANYSTNAGKPGTKEGLRDIIHQERMIELAFEGKRFWDLRRWKKSVQYLNQNITGWSVGQSVATDYYQVRTIFTQTFVAPRDYLWPIQESELIVNPNLVQNLGW